MGILLEGLSAVLYHATDLSVAVQILATDRFKLTSSVISPLMSGDLMNVNLRGRGSIDYKLSDNRFYFGSFARSTRSKYGKYKKSATTSRLMFVVDGVKLGHRYRGRAVNYFSGDGEYDYGGNFDSHFKQPNDEMEDRVVSDKPYIEDFSKYVKEIRVALSLNKVTERLSGSESSDLRKVLILGKQMDLPVRVWLNDDFDLYLRGVRGTQLSTSDIAKFMDGKRRRYTSDVSGVNANNAAMMGALIEFFEGRGDGRKLLRLIGKRGGWSNTDAIDWMSTTIVKDEWERWRVRVMKLVRNKFGGDFRAFVVEMKKRISNL